jgi:hypothetical protein
MSDDISPEERKYIQVYERVSHELQEKKDRAAIVRELMAEGYPEPDAMHWVAAVASQLRSRMVQRSLFALVPGVILLLLGVAFHIALLSGWMYFDPAMATFMLVVGAILSIWGVSSFAAYRDV